MTSKKIKRWFWVHKWSSLVCTLFLLEICLTGLPLVFIEELDNWLDPPPAYAAMPANTLMANLDTIVAKAKATYPNQYITSVFVDDDEPAVFVGLAPTLKPDDQLAHSMQFDQRTAAVLKDEPPFSQQPQTFLGIMVSLHIDLFMGLFGELFLGFMGLLFVAAIVSGVVLYGPFMKKLEFGTVRRERSRRLKWLDLHNLTGIVVMAWMAVVGITGVMNELSTPLFALWQNTDVKAVLDAHQGKGRIAQNQLSSVQAAFDSAKKTLPGMTVTSIVFPNAEESPSRPYHYLLWAKGNDHLTSQLFYPMLVDARTGQVAAVVKMPIYLRALEVSRPLHFGDYGGLPLKIIWAVFDIVAITVLITGIYLWFSKRKAREDWLQKMLQYVGNETE